VVVTLSAAPARPAGRSTVSVARLPTAAGLASGSEAGDRGRVTSRGSPAHSTATTTTGVKRRPEGVTLDGGGGRCAYRYASSGEEEASLRGPKAVVRRITPMLRLHDRVLNVDLREYPTVIAHAGACSLSSPAPVYTSVVPTGSW
jgi:hypothetical protein